MLCLFHQNAHDVGGMIDGMDGTRPTTWVVQGSFILATVNHGLCEALKSLAQNYFHSWDYSLNHCGCYPAFELSHSEWKGDSAFC